jgi:CelD/BcsL family acetyltransferase involved in cellulose biosynthesis
MRREHHVSYSDGEREPATLSALVRLKSGQCHKRGWRDVFASPWVRHLVEQLATTQGPGLSGHVSTLRLDGDLAVVMLGLRSWSVHAMWFSAYEDRYATLSPGIRGFLYAAETAANAGIDILDLGKGDEPYKKQLANRSLVLRSGWVAGAGPGRMLFSGARVPNRLADALYHRSPTTVQVMRGTVHGLRRGRMPYAATWRRQRRALTTARPPSLSN